MQPEIPSYIQGYEAVIRAIGYWPSFHDSPVRRFEVTANGIELEVESIQTDWSRTDAGGHFVELSRYRIAFRFSGIVSTDLQSFAAKNILFSLPFTPPAQQQASEQFCVELDSAMSSDLCGSFCARSGAVISVTAVDSAKAC